MIVCDSENITDYGTSPRMIDAAPDLYAALSDIMACIDAGDAYSCAFEHDAARAALAKAEGGE